MYITILFFPLVGCFFSGFLSQVFGSSGTCRFSVICIFFSFLMSFILLIDVTLIGNVTSFTILPWIHSGLFSSHWGFLFDGLTSVILVVVTSISILVHIYSSSYIEYDPHLCRFISYLSFFTFFIILLVSADNFVQIFVGWEGVGLCSYLLINFWYTRIQANKAAIKAMLVNRVGDFGLALGIFGIFFETGSVEYSTVFSVVPFFFSKTFTFFGFTFHSATLFSFLLFVGAIGKSAQLGLHTWLPDAIEGPTPVSALIHAATIVTAGVFLLVRCSPFFEFCPITLWFVTLFGGITAFFAATTGLFQNDLKKVIAYSTCSQLGYIVFSCGLSAYNVGLFHLANHAFFKALLFLTAGGIIHAVSDEQDIRKIGGLIRIIPFCYSIILVGSLALTGFPFLSGFYSKEVILELAYASSTTVSFFAYILGLLAAFFTAFYSIRSLYLTFFSKPRGFKKVFESAHEVPTIIGFPLVSLFFGSVFFGYFTRDFIIGFGSPFFNNSLFTHPVHFLIVEAEFLPLSIKLIPLLFSFFGILFGIFVYFFFNYSIFFLKISFFGRLFYTFFNKKWFFDKFYTEFIVQQLFVISYNQTYKQLDKGLFELFGPFGFSLFVFNKSISFAKNQSGSLYHYAFVIFFGFFIIIGISFFEAAFFFTDFRLLFFYFIFFIFLLLGGVAQRFRVEACQAFGRRFKSCLSQIFNFNIFLYYKYLANMTFFFSEFLPLFFYFVFSAFLAFIIFFISFVFSQSNSYSEKLSPYECGFDPFDNARNQFEVRFYLVAILFLIFDLEASFLFPWASHLSSITSFGFWVILDFFFELVVGLIYVWSMGTFNWD